MRRRSPRLASTSKRTRLTPTRRTFGSLVGHAVMLDMTWLLWFLFSALLNLRVCCVLLCWVTQYYLLTFSRVRWGTQGCPHPDWSEGRGVHQRSPHWTLWLAWVELVSVNDGRSRHHPSHACRARDPWRCCWQGVSVSCSWQGRLYDQGDPRVCAGPGYRDA